MKIINNISGIFAIIMGVVMFVFAWIFWVLEETSIVQLASLYIAITISCFVVMLGFNLLGRDK